MAQWLNWRWLFWRRREKIEITVETTESWEIHWLRRSKTENCPFCQAEAIFVPRDLGAQIIRADLDAIEKMVTSGKVHVTLSDDKESLICLASLKKSVEKKSVRKILKDEGKIL